MKRSAFDAWMRAQLEAVEAALCVHVRADAPAGLGLFTFVLVHLERRLHRKR